MANSSNGRGKPQIRMTINIEFSSVEEKLSFGDRLEGIRTLLTPPVCAKLDNLSLMNAMFDIVEQGTTSLAGPRKTIDISECVSFSFNEDGGKFRPLPLKSQLIIQVGLMW